MGKLLDRVAGHSHGDEISRESRTKDLADSLVHNAHRDGVVVIPRYIIIGAALRQLNKTSVQFFSNRIR